MRMPGIVLALWLAVMNIWFLFDISLILTVLVAIWATVGSILIIISGAVSDGSKEDKN